jgi:hypothetical protein
MNLCVTLKKITMKKVLLFFVILYTMSYVFSQSTSPDVIITSGDVIVGEEASLSWTIGESLIESFGENDLSLLQGFQELEDYPVAIEEIDSENSMVIVYPTRTTGKVYVVFSGMISTYYNAELIDMSGKICNTYDFNTDHNEINLGEFPQGIYMLIIMDKSNNPVKQLEIVRD